MMQLHAERVEFDMNFILICNYSNTNHIITNVSFKWAYITAMVFFAFLMAYMMFAAIWITIKAVNAAKNETFSELTGANVSTANAILGNPTFRNVILSLSSTYGLWLVASFLFFEPWHMFTCLAQYLLMVPFYVNILNVYAFCNTHDVRYVLKENA